MTNNYPSDATSNLSNGFYQAYEESHNTALKPEDLENDYIENIFDYEDAFGESDCAGL